MKRKYVFWVVVPTFVGVASFLVSYTELGRRWTARDRTPVLECPDVVDLGDRELGQIAVARLTFANRGGGELLIDEIRTNCSCSGLEREDGGDHVRVDKLRLGSGERADLVMRVAVRGTPGEGVRNVVSLHTNDPVRPEARFEVVIPRITGGLFTLPKSAVFGTVPTGGAARQVLEVRDQAKRSRTVERVSSTNPDRFSVRWLPVEPNGGGRAGEESGMLLGRVEVALQTHGPGAVDGSIEIYLSGEARQPISIPVVGRVVSPVEVAPSSLVLPRASGNGRVYFGDCLCRSNCGKPMSLTVDSAANGLTVQVSAVGNPAARLIRIAWDPASDDNSAAPRLRSVRLIARTEGQELAVEIPVHCRAGGGSR